MPLNLDAYLGVHPDALKVAAKRSELLAANLANADTPNYKSRDIDFRAALADAKGPNAPVALHATQAGHISTAGNNSDPLAAVKYRVPFASALDGNTVDAQAEQANFAENAVRYQATLTFLNSKFRGLMTAITGQ